MDTLLNMAAIKAKMTDKPKGQRLYYFFYGEGKMLSASQVTEVQKIIDEDYKKTKAFLKEAKKSAPKD